MTWPYFREPTIEGFADYIKRSQLTEAHKNNFIGHLASNMSELTGMDQHTAEQAIYAGVRALVALALNKWVGNPGGKLWNGVKKLGEKVSSISRKKEPLQETQNDSGDKKTTNTSDNSIINSDSSDSRHDNSSSKNRKNYNIKKTQKYMEKELNQQKIDLELRGQVLNCEFDFSKNGNSWPDPYFQAM